MQAQPPPLERHGIGHAYDILPRRERQDERRDLEDSYSYSLEERTDREAKASKNHVSFAPHNPRIFHPLPVVHHPAPVSPMVSHHSLRTELTAVEKEYAYTGHP